MQDENHHTSQRRTSQLSHKDRVAAVRRIIASEFTAHDLIELKKYINGLITVATREEQSHG